MQTRHEYLEQVRQRVERGEYAVPSEAVAQSLLVNLALSERPIGSLTPIEREVVTRSYRHYNQQARRRIEATDADRLFPRSLCPVHWTPYAIKTGDRGQDCSFCRHVRENADATRRMDSLHQGDGMREATRVEPSYVDGLGDYFDDWPKFGWKDLMHAVGVIVGGVIFLSTVDWIGRMLWGK